MPPAVVLVEEVLVVLISLGFARRMADTPAEKGARLDLIGTGLSALGLALLVYGIRSGTWGFFQPKAGAPAWLGLSPVISLILSGGVALRVFLWSENHRLARGGAALLIRRCCGTGPCGRAHLVFLPVLPASRLFCRAAVLVRSARALGGRDRVRLLPLSITLLLAAAGIPKVFPSASPRRVVQIGFVALFAGIVITVAALTPAPGPRS